jgi:hypothetical protein
MYDAIFSHDIFVIGWKTPYPLLQIMYNRISKEYALNKFGERKMYDVLIHHILK